MSKALQVLHRTILDIRPQFESVLVDRSINFDREAEFAIQILSKSNYALEIAVNNRQSVIDAVTNVAAIGISLNPARRQAYLVPRDGSICLDISYIGLLDLAMESGSIRWGQARLVHEKDSFELQGLDREPIHRYSPFGKDRGDVIGAYCVVKTADGDYLTDAMSAEEINSIRDRSVAWKAWLKSKKKCPWVTDWGEMARKTVVKRAYKYWPKTERLEKAIHHLNNDSGEGLADLATPEPDALKCPPDLLNEAENAARKGLDAYSQFFESIGKANRVLLKQEHSRLKSIAVEADEARTIEEPKYEQQEAA